MVTVQAPAKINLTLEVLAKRDDGYHELRSVIQTINLCDTIHLVRSDHTSYHSESAEWDGEKSLVSKAVRLFSEETGCSNGVSVIVEKRIPMMAGLGGDSSDAAAALRGLDRLFETGLPLQALHRMAEKLGSDVPFFLYGGTALIEGRGERVTSLPPVRPVWIVLLVPEMDIPPGKTGRLFSALTPELFTAGEKTERFITNLEKGITGEGIFNVFEKVAWDVFPGLGEYRDILKKLSGNDAHLAGSGPVLFTLVEDESKAGELHGKLAEKGMQSFLAKTESCCEIQD